MQPKGCKYISLKDGRRLCPECFSFVIMDTDECQPLFHEIQEFFASLNMKLNQQIPLSMVEREALNDAMEEEKNVRTLRLSFWFFIKCYLCLTISGFICLGHIGKPPFIRNSRALLVRRANHSHCKNFDLFVSIQLQQYI